MGREWDHITKELSEFCLRQHIFFVATAPQGDGHVNLSPKGYESFRILDPNTVAYLDLTGSGVETIAHLRQNGRITIMFTAFDGPANIVRLYGTGEVLMPDTDAYQSLAQEFEDLPGARAIIRINVHRVSSSCGYGVPLMTYSGERNRLKEWAEAKTDEDISAYQADNNKLSIDGLPGI